MRKPAALLLLFAVAVTGCGRAVPPDTVPPETSTATQVVTRVTTTTRPAPATTLRSRPAPTTARPRPAPTTTEAGAGGCLEDYIEVMEQWRRVGGSDGTDAELRALQQQLRTHYDRCGGAAVLAQIEVIENWIWFREKHG